MTRAKTSVQASVPSSGYESMRIDYGFEHDVWQNVFRSVVFETDAALSDSSGVVVSLWTITCPIPSLFKDVQNAVCNFTDTRTIGSL